MVCEPGVRAHDAGKSSSNHTPTLLIRGISALRKQACTYEDNR